MKKQDLYNLVQESLDEVLEEIMSVNSLVKGKKYNWTMGAEPLTITYIGTRNENPDIKVGSSVGKGYIFKWDDGRHLEIGPITLRQNVEELEEEGQGTYEEGYNAAKLKYKKLAEAYKKLKETKQLQTESLWDDILNTPIYDPDESDEELMGAELGDTQPDESLFGKAVDKIAQAIDYPAEKTLQLIKKLAQTAGLKEDQLNEARFKKGEDIGKKGPGFEKIAKAAAKKYGSEEAGKKVAGAILKKVLKKQGK